MRGEINSMRNNKVWELTILPNNNKPIICMWIFISARKFGTMEYFAATFAIIYTKGIVLCGNSFSWNIEEEEIKIRFANQID